VNATLSPVLRSPSDHCTSDPGVEVRPSAPSGPVSVRIVPTCRPDPLDDRCPGPVTHALKVFHAPSAPSRGRRWIREQLGASGIPLRTPWLDDAEAVTGELLADAVRDARPVAGGMLLLSWVLLPDQVTIRVTDGGPRRDPPDAGPWSVSPLGHAPRALERLCGERGVHTHVGGLRTVWCQLPRCADPRPGVLRLVR
jgi:hypothetical protein